VSRLEQVERHTERGAEGEVSDQVRKEFGGRPRDQVTTR